MRFKIIGYERNKGFSKKKNCDYDWHILHTQATKPLTGSGAGYQVERILISVASGIIAGSPAPGDVWEIVFNRFGRIEDAYPVLAAGEIEAAYADEV